MTFTPPPDRTRAAVAVRSHRQLVALGLAAAAVALTVAYLVLVNSVAARGVELRQLRSELEHLKLAGQELGAQVVERQSLAAATPAPEFVEVDRVEYLAAVPPTVGVAVR